MPFVTTRKTEYIGEGHYRLIEPLVYSMPSGTITVPRGFATDLASMPRALRWLVSTSALWSNASVLHDYLYGVQRWDRPLADACFRKAMLEDPSVKGWEAAVMYAGVRIGGWYPYYFGKCKARKGQYVPPWVSGEQPEE